MKDSTERASSSFSTVDEEHRCGETMSFGDDFGDNNCTFFCQLRRGHAGAHLEVGELHGQHYDVTWRDET